MAFAPSTIVSPPTRAALPYGLFSTFAFRPAGDRWETGGVRFETVGCGPLAGYGETVCDPNDPPPGWPLDPATGTPLDVGDASAFTIVGRHSCSPVANSPEDAVRLAEQRLLHHEERSVEYAFWTGALGNTPALRGAEPLTSGPVSIPAGIGLLEEWLAREYGHLGVLHLPRLIASAAGDHLSRTGAALRSPLGTPIAAGAGYDGSGPDGAAPPAGTAQRWIYATPALIGYRTDVYVPADGPALFDRATNTVSAEAHRTYLLGFEDCGVAAALVDPGAVTASLNVAAPAAPSPYLTV